MHFHLGKIGTLSLVQSAYRHNYSTETALTKVVSDIIMAADAGDVTVLALLDSSDAFDTVDHVILLQRLQTTHHVTGNDLQWFRSYLHGRYQSVLFAGETSTPVSVAHGIPPVLYLDRYCSYFTHLTFLVLLQRMDYYACVMLMIPNCTFI